MKNPIQKLKTIHNLEKFFIVVGLVEILAIVSINHNLLSMSVGVITIIPAYMTFKEGKMKSNYFTGIWALIKYNPIGLALFSFVLRDSIRGNTNTITEIIYWSWLLIAISSFVFGIIIIVKTRKYLKNKSIQVKTSENLN